MCAGQLKPAYWTTTRRKPRVLFKFLLTHDLLTCPPRKCSGTEPIEKPTLPAVWVLKSLLLLPVRSQADPALRALRGDDPCMFAGRQCVGDPRLDSTR